MKKLNSEKTIYILKRAMLNLLTEKAFSEISISDITEAANLNRTTFYLFFSSKKELLLSISEDMLFESEKYLQDFFDATSNNQRKEIILQIYEYNTKKLEDYKIMFEIDENFLCFFAAYEESIKKICLREIDHRYPNVKSLNRKLFSEWFTASLISTFRLFIREGVEEHDALADLILTCLDKGFNQILV